MSLQRTDILHASGVYNAAAGTAYSNQGFASFVRVDVGVYELTCDQSIGAREASIDVRAGVNEIAIVSAEISAPGVVTVRAYDTFANPFELVTLDLKVWQVQAGPTGTIPGASIPTPIIPPGGPVLSVFGRIGAVVAALNDYVASLIGNDSGVAGATVKDALDNLQAAIPPAAPVDSVFGRIGAVVAALNDYVASLIGNDSGVAGATVKDALDNLQAAIPPAAPVDSVFGRIGAVVAAVNDYVASLIGNDSGIFGATVKDALNTIGTAITTLMTDVSALQTAVTALIATAPTANEKAALAGTAGAPTGANPYVVDDDPRLALIPSVVSGGLLVPEAGITGYADTGISDVQFIGASYTVDRDMDCNGLWVDIELKLSNITLYSVVYESIGGGEGPAALLAHVTQAVTIPNPAFTPTLLFIPFGGTKRLTLGSVIYFMMQESAIATRYGCQISINAPLYSQLIPPDCHPVAFTSTISRTAPPATIDPSVDLTPANSTAGFVFLVRAAEV